MLEKNEINFEFFLNIDLQTNSINIILKGITLNIKLLNKLASAAPSYNNPSLLSL